MREELLEYEGDVYYDVWCLGGEPDAIDFERVDECFYADMPPDEAASIEIRSQERQVYAEPENEEVDWIMGKGFK